MTKTVTYCLHLKAFGCEECKAIVKSEIEQERERCIKIIETAGCMCPPPGCYEAVCYETKAIQLIREGK